jgi:hypothetical protein
MPKLSLLEIEKRLKALPTNGTMNLWGKGQRLILVQRDSEKHYTAIYPSDKIAEVHKFEGDLEGLMGLISKYRRKKNEVSKIVFHHHHGSCCLATDLTISTFRS